jgi:hypothetical protein
VRRPLALLLLLLLAAPAFAQDPPPLTVGVYAPRLVFADSLARTKMAEQIAGALQSATGRPMRGRGFVNGDEFFQQVAGGEVQFAVVDAQALAERGGLEPLAQGTSGGQAARPMVLVVRPSLGAARVADLQGRALANVNAGGRDAQFLHNFLLQGQIDAGFFEQAREVRDVHSALSLVRLGKADATFTYAGTEDGLPAAFTSRPVPLPVFVRAGAEVDAAVLSAVKGAIGAVRVEHPTLDGFGRFDAGAHGALRAALKGDLARPGTDPVIAPAAAALPPVPAFPEPIADVPVVLPAPALPLPAPPPDEF